MIAQLVAGRKVQGFNEGSTGVDVATKTNITHVGGKSEQKLISDIIRDNAFLSDDQKGKLRALEAILKSQGLPATTATLHKLAFTFPEHLNKSMTSSAGVDPKIFIAEWEKLGPGKWSPSRLPAASVEAMDRAIIEIIKQDFADGKIKGVNDNLVRDYLYKENSSRTSRDCFKHCI